MDKNMEGEKEQYKTMHLWMTIQLKEMKKLQDVC